MESLGLIRFHRKSYESNANQVRSSNQQSASSNPIDQTNRGINQNQDKLKENSFSNKSNANAHRQSVSIVDRYRFDEQIMMNQVHQLMIELKQSRFVDETFPSLFKPNPIDENKENVRLVDSSVLTENQLQWLTYDQIHPPKWIYNKTSEWTIFRNPKPNDVIQGALGDCWLMTALSVLAEREEYLMRILLTKQVNDQGIFSVRLCPDGQWTSIIVDDRFPCTLKKCFAYSQAHRKQLWVAIIEKALAKFYGNYEMIIAGRCSEGLSIVSGYPCETILLDDYRVSNVKMFDENLLWKKLFDARQKKFLMCAMCHNDRLTNEQFSRYGLLNNHAYSLQDIRQTNRRFIKLRNPWGNKKQVDDASFDRCLLSSNEIDQQQFDNDHDEQSESSGGVFWISFRSFIEHFECVDICKIRSNWFEIRDWAYLTADSSGMIDGFHLEIANETEIEITIWRKFHRSARLERRHEICFAFALIQVETSSNVQHRIYSIQLLSDLTDQTSINQCGSVKKGTFYVLPISFNPMSKPIDEKRIHIAIHSRLPVYLQRIQFQPTIQREFLIKLCLFHGEQLTKRSETETNLSTNYDEFIRIFELKQFWDGIIFLVENRHQKKKIHFYFRCTLSQNAHLSRKHIDYQLFDVIPAMHRQIIIIVSRKNRSHSLTFAHDFQYLFSSQHFHQFVHSNKYEHWPQIDDSTLSQLDLHLPQPILTLTH